MNWDEGLMMMMKEEGDATSCQLKTEKSSDSESLKSGQRFGIMTISSILKI